MTVMRETGLLVVSTTCGSLYQLSLEEGELVEQIKFPCEHRLIYMLCVQVAGREYLALSCPDCRDIKLMNLNKQKGNSSESQLIQYEVITAFRGQWVRHMCQGEENRLFVQSSDSVVLELNTSTTTFTKVRTIDIGDLRFLYGLCYVPDSHRLLVISDRDEVRAVSCDDKKTIWTVHSDLNKAKIAYMPTHKSIIVADCSRNRVVILSPIDGSLMQSIQLSDYVHAIQGLYFYNDQIIVIYVDDISYFSLK